MTGSLYNRRMARPASIARMTYAEYLAAEAASDIRHEYLNGEVWAMAGGTPSIALGNS